MADDWHLDSWKKRTALQQPTYDDASGLDTIVDQLSVLPPLVTSWEIDKLKSLIARAQCGEAWLLQGGDCAESFADCQSEKLRASSKCYCK